jgi:hypothetical protein
VAIDAADSGSLLSRVFDGWGGAKVVGMQLTQETISV